MYTLLPLDIEEDVDLYCLLALKLKTKGIPNSTFAELDNDLESADVVSIVDDENDVLQEM
jgi:hypothetical protein